MSLQFDEINNQVLPLLNGATNQKKWENCAREFSWYPFSWLALAKNGTEADAQKAAIWFNDEFRLHWILADKVVAKSIVSEKIIEVEIPEENEETAIENVVTEQIPEPEITAPATESIEEEIVIGNEETAIGNVVAEQILEPEMAASATERIEEELVVENEELITVSKVESTSAGLPNTEPENTIKPQLEEIIGQKQEPLLAFESYHVVDYFASQGIKIDINDIPKTQLDKQMKSFTQWLRTMKKINIPDSKIETDPLVDAQASASIHKKEIITEAMADVYEKQGLYKNAIDVFEKLILLHPEKISFFAARINDIKNKQ